MGWDKKDRCGAGKFSTGPNDPFTEECVAHDEGYLRGGSVDQMVDVDGNFYSGIWKKALKNPLLIPRAAVYTAIVALLGRWWWRPYDRTKV